MCLVAQFGKWLFRIILFFGTNAFDVNIGQKSHCRVPRLHFLLHAEILSQGLLFIFKELQ